MRDLLSCGQPLILLLIEEARSRKGPDTEAWWCLELAKLHTALAQVTAAALNCDGREWVQVTGRRFSRTESIVHGQ